MNMPALVWEEFHFDDPDGGKIIFWPHIPCIRMPVKLRSHSNFHGVAFNILNRPSIMDNGR